MSAGYDEGAIAAGLDELSVDQRVLFACACAERLVPLYGLFMSMTGLGDLAMLREMLDVAWGVQPMAGADADLDRGREAVEQLVPNDDDEDWSVWSPFAQNAAAAVAYALRTWLSGESQNAVWAA